MNWKFWRKQAREQGQVVVMLPATVQALPPRRSETVIRINPEPERKRFFTVGESKAFIGWEPSLVSADTALYGNLNMMKARARDLARNNDYMKHFLRLLVSNVIGPRGFRLQCLLKKGEERHREVNKLIETYWNASGKLKNSPSICGKMTRRDMSILWLKTLAVDGEAITIRHPGFKGNKFRTAVQIIDPALLDWTLNESLSNGVKIKMGVEMDENDTPIAYHFLNHHPFDLMWSNTKATRHTRVEASRVRHTFLMEFPGQTRGISWLASPAVRSHMLSKFEEAVVVGARVAASKMGFYRATADYEGEAPGDAEDDDGTMRNTVEPGVFEQLPRGIEVQTFDPSFPPANLEEFMNSQLKGLASGLGIDYVSMANNLEGVNYSSIRAGNIEQQAIWRSLQQFEIDHFEDPHFSEWTEIQAINPDVAIDAKHARDLLLLDAYKFIPRGWQWVDPLKEVQANTQAIDALLTSRSRVVAETLGEDYEDMLEEMAECKRLEDKYGIEPQRSHLGNLDASSPAQHEPDPKVKAKNKK